MKRPQGFDRPPVPRSTRAPVDASPVASPARSAAPAKTAATPARSRHAGSADRVETEPIAVVAPAVTSVGEAPADRAPGARIEPDSARDPRAAARALRIAERERRRYERAEVRRFTKRSRRRRITWAVVAGSIVALIAVIAVGAYSPIMALRTVRVEGAARVPAAEVQAAFADLLGTPLPLIDPADVQAALAAFPLIETYATETIPPGTLVVRVVERTPVGVVETEAGFELVDAAGVVLDRPAERPEGQPLIEVEGGVTGEGFRSVASVVRSLPADVRSQLSRATAATVDDVRLDLTSGASVVWGNAEDSAFKADVLAALMNAAPPDTVSLYDVSSPKSPVWR